MESDLTLRKFIHRQRNQYRVIIIVGLVLLIFIYLLNNQFDFDIVAMKYVGIIGWILFIASLLSGIIFPLLYRNLLRLKFKKSKHGGKDLIRYEKNTLYMGLSTMIPALLAYLIKPPEFYLYGSLLVTLYSISINYPERRKIIIDLKSFDVEIEEFKGGILGSS